MGKVCCCFFSRSSTVSLIQTTGYEWEEGGICICSSPSLPPFLSLWGNSKNLPSSLFTLVLMRQWLSRHQYQHNCYLYLGLNIVLHTYTYIPWFLTWWWHHLQACKSPRGRRSAQPILSEGSSPRPACAPAPVLWPPGSPCTCLVRLSLRTCMCWVMYNYYVDLSKVILWRMGKNYACRCIYVHIHTYIFLATYLFHLMEWIWMIHRLH